jgi:hypothetical protein
MDSCLRWSNFSFFQKKCLVVLTLCVALSCLLRHLMLWPKYNKSKMDNIQIWNTYKIKRLISCRLWFYDSNSIWFLYHLGVEYFVKEIRETIIWDNTLVHSIMLSLGLVWLCCFTCCPKNGNRRWKRGREEQTMDKIGQPPKISHHNHFCRLTLSSSTTWGC